ncbi:hypothetical protein AB0K86_33045 [Streptomyces clavifer]|uniref:hypothetical protein n=1 Tax=Streptomyces TaxID=1883 RepID=UPI0006F82891|nr:hypothetical protein [Streptomyces sp. Root55]KQZ07262.1 hypothetical protein ASD51_34295 [Streptomyces sp. Root55]
MLIEGLAGGHGGRLLAHPRLLGCHLEVFPTVLPAGLDPGVVPTVPRGPGGSEGGIAAWQLGLFSPAWPRRLSRIVEVDGDPVVQLEVVTGLKAWALLDEEQHRERFKDLVRAYIDVVKHQRDGRVIC